MRSLFKLSLLGVAALALTAGGAWAQDATFKTGLILTEVFGMFDVKTDTKYTDEFESDKSTSTASRYQTEFQFDFTALGTTGPVTTRALIRFRDTGTSTVAPGGANENVPNTVRGNIDWKVSDLFTLGFAARSHGLPASSVAYGVYNSSTCSAGCTIGEVTGPVGFYANSRGLDFRFNVAGMQVGALLVDDCIPGCGYDPRNITVAAAAATQVAGKDKSTTVPYFMGAFGPVTVGAYLANSQGKIQGYNRNGYDQQNTTGVPTNAGNRFSDTVKDKDTWVKGELTDVNLRVNLGIAQLAFELFNVSASCDKNYFNAFQPAGFNTGTCSSQDTSSTVFGGRVNVGPGRIEAHLSSVETKNSIGDTTLPAAKANFKSTSEDLMVGYVYPITPAVNLNPIYASRTDVATITRTDGVNTAKVETTNNATFIALGARATF